MSAVPALPLSHVSETHAAQLFDSAVALQRACLNVQAVRRQLAIAEAEQLSVRAAFDELREPDLA